jgi:hypothetical protein
VARSACTDCYGNAACCLLISTRQPQCAGAQHVSGHTDSHTDGHTDLTLVEQQRTATASGMLGLPWTAALVRCYTVCVAWRHERLSLPSCHVCPMRSDKTGTLTTSSMDPRRIWAGGWAVGVASNSGLMGSAFAASSGNGRGMQASATLGARHGPHHRCFAFCWLPSTLERSVHSRNLES